MCVYRMSVRSMCAFHRWQIARMSVELEFIGKLVSPIDRKSTHVQSTALHVRENSTSESRIPSPFFFRSTSGSEKKNSLKSA